MKTPIKTFLAGTALAVALSFGAGAATAATVTYQNADPTPQMQLTVDDSTPGTFRFTLTTLVGAADFLALGFNLAGSSNPLTSASFALVSATNAANQIISPALVLFGNDTGSQNTCGQGCNFNGAGSATLFDYILRIGSNGSSGADYVQSVTFDLTFAGTLANNPFSQLGIRAQSTSNAPNNSGSIKTDLTLVNNPPPPPPVPLPASGLLLATGLAFLGWKRRKA